MKCNCISPALYDNASGYCFPFSRQLFLVAFYRPLVVVVVLLEWDVWQEDFNLARTSCYMMPGGWMMLEERYMKRHSSHCNASCWELQLLDDSSGYQLLCKVDIYGMLIIAVCVCVSSPDTIRTTNVRIWTQIIAIPFESRLQKDSLKLIISRQSFGVNLYRLQRAYATRTVERSHIAL